MSEHAETTVTGIILAGGEGRRMHGQDKGLLVLQNRPLIEWCVARLLPQVDHVVISANRHLDHYRNYPATVVQDLPGNHYQGPLAGIIAALSIIDTTCACITPVDAPLIPRKLVATLLPHSANGTRLTLPRIEGRIQPLFALYPRNTLAELKHYYAQDQRKLMTWCLSQQPAIVDWSGSSVGFSNINTPDALHALQQCDLNAL